MIKNIGTGINRVTTEGDPAITEEKAVATKQEVGVASIRDSFQTSTEINKRSMKHKEARIYSIRVMEHSSQYDHPQVENFILPLGAASTTSSPFNPNCLPVESIEDWSKIIRTKG